MNEFAIVERDSREPNKDIELHPNTMVSVVKRVIIVSRAKPRSVLTVLGESILISFNSDLQVGYHGRPMARGMLTRPPA